MSTPHMSAHPTRSAHVAAVIGGLSALPFFTANAIVAQRIEPFFSVIRPGPHTSTFELVLLAVVLLCLPAGAYVAARPLFASNTRRPSAWIVNGTISVVLLVAFVVISTALGGEIYRCEVLGIPNCD
jgi:hypothetical protein